MADDDPIYRASDRIAARVPVGGAYEEEVYPGNDWLEWTVWSFGKRRSRPTPRGWIGIR